MKKIITVIMLLLLIGCAAKEKTEIQNTAEIQQATETKNSEEPVTAQEPSPAKRCNDGTIYRECSLQKPYHCSEGNIIKKSSLCGCPENQIASGENCVSAFEITPVEREYKYILQGKQDSIKLTVYKELNDFLSAKPRVYPCTPECPSPKEIELQFIDNPEQEYYLKQLAKKIQEKNPDKAIQARTAIALVQSIPYADAERRHDELTGRYPYEVLYDQKGVCGEKSLLLTFILRELGYGTALFHYPNEKHMAAGIKCPMDYSYNESGYCFIETVEPIIATYIPSEYIDIDTLGEPEIIQISQGETFDIRQEYNDARELERLNKLGLVLEPKDYASWRDLMKKYGIYVRGRLFFK